MSGFSVATAPATAPHRLLALIVILVVVVAYAAVIPYGSIPLPRIDSYVPAVLSITFVTDLITAVLLFAQFAATGSRPLLILAGGSLFSALVVVGYTLIFPGAFAPEGLLGGGPQSSAWLYFSWRMGFAASLALYAIQRSETRSRTTAEATSRRAILWCIAGVTVLACGLIFAATAGYQFLPGLLADGKQLPLARYANGAILLVNVIALVLLARVRDKSILDLWLIVVAVSWLGEGVITTFFFHGRYTLAFYAIRLVGLPVSKVVLIIMLWETIRLYANLTISHRALQRERANRLTNAATLMAAVAHEVRQPMAAINLLAFAGQQSLERATPDVGAGRKSLLDIRRAAARANEVFDNFLRLVRSGRRELQPVDINALTLEVAGLVQKDLDEHNVTIATKLAPDLPAILAHKGQIREVILNLIQNAIEAMAPMEGAPRLVHIETARLRRNAVSITLRDTGPGIETDRLTSIFDPFVTTKADGNGLGLAICKMIVDQHDGRLLVENDRAGGAVFTIELPTGPAAPPAPADRAERRDLQTTR